uniref:Uncharacterized protein n=1 Tax=viral metagenome TaxID=1070528 RepID=A0A6M3KSJ5_9ZZZZ
MTKLRACDQCKREPAEWALQYISADKPSFTTLGSHYRGWSIKARLCNVCKEELLAAQPHQSAPDLPSDDDARSRTGTHYLLKEYP